MDQRKQVVAPVLAGIVLIVLWAVLAFVVQVANGWIHLALAAGVSLVAVGIIRTDPPSERHTS